MLNFIILNFRFEYRDLQRLNFQQNTLTYLTPPTCTCSIPDAKRLDFAVLVPALAIEKRDDENATRVCVCVCVCVCKRDG